MNIRSAHLSLLLKLLFLSTYLLPCTRASAALTDLPSQVRSKEFSLSRKALALQGYDPVAYFKDGPRKGDDEITYVFKGIVYRFASTSNRVQFIQQPAQYEPQYGGWCAWAMADKGGRTEANPKSFKIINGKLYVFYDGLFGDTLARWNEVGDDAGLIHKADRYWADQVLK